MRVECCRLLQQVRKNSLAMGIPTLCRPCTSASEAAIMKLCVWESTYGWLVAVIPE